MIIRRIKSIFSVMHTEFGKSIRSTRLVLLGLFALIAYTLIFAPMEECAIQMGSRVSYLEGFCALGNSSMILLLYPLFYLIIISDYPREDGINVFYQVRCRRSDWICGQILFAASQAVLLEVFGLVISVVLLGSNGKWSTDFSYAVTHYVNVFPDKKYSYVSRILSENLYNQLTLMKAVMHTCLLLFMYFMILALVILLFDTINNKLAGVLIDGLIISGGVILCAADIKQKWLFPMAHSISWLHYTEYDSEEIFPMKGSYIYFISIILVLMVLCFTLRKKKQVF